MQRISITNPQNIIDGTAKKYYFKLRNTGGPKGDKGEKGDTGQTGPQGPKGDAATVAVGSTTTLPVGYDATVENVGSLYNAVLNFGIPQGPQGPQGAKGDKGDTGAQGETGPRGPQGEKGTNATVYVGTTSTLNPGSQATVYNSGSDSNAVLNFGIPQGAKGDIGNTGPQGPAGQNFAATVVTELPETGDSSKLYLTPKAHTTQTATGNPITATVAEDAGALESFQLDGDTAQQTYTGKNLWSNTPYKVGYYISPDGREAYNDETCIYGNIETSPNTTYTLTLTNLGVSANVRAHAYDENGNWIEQIGVLFISTDEKKSMTFTTPANTKYLRWSFWVKSMVADGQVELGSTATSFEPYVGGQPSPNPSYPQQIQTVTGEQTVTVIGKNLFDKTKDTVGSYLNSSGDILGSGTWDISEYIEVKSGKKYTISGVVTPGTAPRYCYYDSNKQFVSSVAGGDQTITIPSGVMYIRLSVYNGTSTGSSLPDDTGTLQLELGASASSYAPFSSTDYPISLGSIKLYNIEGYRDYIHKVGEDWIITKRTISILLNEYSSIYRGSFGTNPFYTALPQGSGGAENTKNVISDYFYGIPYTDRTLELPNSIFNTFVDNSPVLYIRNTPWATIGDFKSWLSEHNVKVYSKRTPIDTIITDTTLIAQLEAIRTASLGNGANTITNTATGTNLAGDMEIGYFGFNPTNRYDKFIWLDLNNNYEQIGGE